MNDINLMTWFSKRELDYCPKHFVRTNTPLDEERTRWILENLKGRYHITYSRDQNNDNLLFLFDDPLPCFEDPQEAVLYELTFS
jgi:hypothetical protein